MLTKIHIMEYHCLLTQDGTPTNPTERLLHNTLNKNTITWTRNSDGNYTGTLPNGFPENKTSIILGCRNAGSIYSASWVSVNTINIQTTVGGEAIDGVLSNTPCEIKVYTLPIKEIL